MTPTNEVLSDMAACGLTPSKPDTIEFDTPGIVRYHVQGDKPGTRNGYWRGFSDGRPAGIFGSWKTGQTHHWVHGASTATDADRERIRAIQREREQEQEARHAAASAKAISIWADAAPADPAHPYLQRKGVAPGIARQRGDMLILPIVDFPGPLRGIQTISPTGEKRFTKGMHKQGGFIPVNGKKPEPGKRLLICEGWATGQSLAALSPEAVVLAALDCGNLQAVAVEARRRFPQIDLVVAADADEIGMAKAKAAAVASHAKWIWPRFPKDAPEGLSDFNDWSVWRKSQGVAHV
ncbi:MULTISPECIES: toprim domain-containing protein [Acidithiobacillus]|uniref:DNA primase TraC n=2 Tax=Acidithiobacillus ferridurans TaxID=1232575 RepID=A0A2Z6ILN7_ACIFI|nr:MULTISPECIES: toprim domain-containing protein [Acidithiobacillus]MBU2715191.1 hypothetical protein [Acidithiobacillus ferridurans]MBU2721994.1 hypothetical protein [Acidithiobacillus ferridurans]MBU2727488.1 hypothetical protein [Acidithiobacillus ferridurans]BBF66701.1 DNA primase TraC [Acidithiobacillus ferridurans]